MVFLEDLDVGFEFVLDPIANTGDRLVALIRLVVALASDQSAIRLRQQRSGAGHVLAGYDRQVILIVRPRYWFVNMKTLNFVTEDVEVGSRMESHRRGELTEAIVIAELKRRGVPVSTPFGDDERYDLIVETPDSRLLRVQVKTGWLDDDGVIQVKGKSQHTNSTGHVYKTYEDAGAIFWRTVTKPRTCTG